MSENITSHFSDENEDLAAEAREIAYLAALGPHPEIIGIAQFELPTDEPLEEQIAE